MSVKNRPGDSVKMVQEQWKLGDKSGIMLTSINRFRKSKKVSSMKKKRNPNSTPFKDFWRLANAQDLLSRAGTLMMRKSPRATIWTAGITSSGYLSSYLGLPGFTGLQAIVAPFVVGGGLLGIGAGIKYIPRTLSGRLRMIAEANDLNLMEDYRKSQVDEHLNVLWDKVFRYESNIRYSRDEAAAERNRIIADKEYIKAGISRWDKGMLERLGAKNDEDIDSIVTAIMTARPLSDDMEKSREGYIISSLYALKNALPQSSQAKEIGFRLNLYEDARDGAYFDRSDVKLFEQYMGNMTLTDIKAEVGLGRTASIRQLPKKASWSFWFSLVTRKIAASAGRAVKQLNESCNTNLFNSQVLLWPGEESAKWLADFPGAKEKVLELRKSIIHGTLGDSYENAAMVLDRMLLPCFEFATDLRMRYDLEYCDGSLDYIDEDKKSAIKNNCLSDLEAYGYRQKDIARAQQYVKNAADALSSFMDYLDTTEHRGLFDDKPALRAVKTAFHINKNQLRSMFRDKNSAAFRAEIDREIEKAAAQKELYSDRLIGLRLHHQLTMLQIRGYKELAKRLAYSQ